MEFERRRPYPHQENPKPQQGSVEGNKGQQRPETFDGHEPDAWLRDSAIFKSRTLEGMTAVRKEIERAGATADFVAEINREEEAKQLAETGKVDLLFSSTITNLEHVITMRDYEMHLIL